MKRIQGIIALIMVAMLCFAGYAEETTNVSEQESASVSAYLPMEKGAKGDAVKALQERLNELGYKLGKADGDFGKKTYNAVCDFQKYNDLEATGIVDAELYDLIFSSEAKKKDNTKPVDGWYVSDDGEFAVKPSNLRKSNNGYLVSVQIRHEATKQIIIDTDSKINTESNIVLSLIEGEAIREFVCKGEERGGLKYSFKIACDVGFENSSEPSGYIVLDEFNFTLS